MTEDSFNPTSTPHPNPSDSSATEQIPTLDEKERRVLGVLAEKSKTTPDAYPMSLSALVSGCNQKTNRDPITQYDSDEVEEVLEGLMPRGAVVRVEGHGRVVRWKHQLYHWLGVTRGEMAILAELMLRGAQSIGDLRGRVARMEPVADLDQLQEMLTPLLRRGLVLRLSPPEVRRGVIVAHGFYPPKELEAIRTRVLEGSSTESSASPPTRPAAPPDAVAALQAELNELRGRVEVLERKLADLE